MLCWWDTERTLIAQLAVPETTRNNLVPIQLEVQALAFLCPLMATQHSATVLFAAEVSTLVSHSTHVRSGSDRGRKLGSYEAHSLYVSSRV